MNNEKKLKDLIEIYKESGGLGCYESIAVWNLLRLMLDAGIDSTTIDSGDIGMLITDHCIEIVKHDNEAGDFKTIATISLTIYDNGL